MILKTTAPRFFAGLIVAVLATFVSAQDAAKPFDYGQAWPEGRGFKVGDTVPDIPLTDMDGKEVRLSEYLGKRYVLYCWASW